MHLSAFVKAAVRNELDRRRLFAFVEELADELGAADEAEVAKYSELFPASAATGKPHELNRYDRPGRGHQGS